MEYTKRAVRGAAVVLVMYLLAGLFGYLFRLLLARNLTPPEYGLFYAVFTFVMFFAIFTDFSLSSAVVKFIPEYQVKKKYDLIKSSVVFVFAVQLVLSTVMALIFYFGSTWLAVNYFHNPGAVPIIKLFAIVFWFSCFNIFTASLQGFQDVFAYSLINLVKVAIALIFAAILIYLGFGVLGAAYSYLVAYLVISVLAILLFFKKFPKFSNYRTKINRSLIKSLLRFGIAVTLASFSYMVVGYTDTLVLTYFKPLSDVALYNVAMPIATILVWLLAYPFSTVLLPMASEMWHKKHTESLKAGMESLQKYAVLGVTPIALMMLAFPETIIRLLFGSAYVGASTSLQILSVGMIFYSVAHINSSVISGIGKPETNTKIIGFIAILNLVLNVVLVPFFGIVGASVASSLSYIVMMVLTTLSIRKYVSIEIPYEHFIKSLILGLLTILLVYYLKSVLSFNYLLEAVVIAAIALTFYTLLALLLKMADLKEIFKIIKSVMKSV